MSLSFDTVLDQLESGEIYTGIHNSNRRGWFKYCYHFSHVENIVSILNDGRLLSRNQAIREGKMKSDNASQKVIDQTNPEYKDYVRFYFRPKSPTQYHNEGFKTREQLEISELGAQCAVPVFLLLDIRKLLSQPECLFTETSLAGSGPVSLYSTPEEFKKLPFDKIYHDRALSHDEKRSIIGHRHAEIIVPNSLPLDEYLMKIVVRTPAEKETLLALMSEDLREKYEKYVQIDTSNVIFFSRWTYFHTAQLKSEYMRFDLRISQQYLNNSKPVQFDLEAELGEADGTVKKQTIMDWTAKSVLTIPFKEPRDKYDITLKFDNHLMYKGRFQAEDDLPF
ncbi:protein of unknown function [Alkalibacterium subtropicum]|uniref:DarT domain-containing protein n=1 Tax=Alkalibacterium subtropicum TaxID=753702 RepID=A0A1I1GMD7_9LACT|nr:DUF4433 domain-containing protein [Alkalibacterium subtropicum]SFC10290.1 protein of unknown function [Alkalibacterium subtropicum]